MIIYILYTTLWQDTKRRFQQLKSLLRGYFWSLIEQLRIAKLKRILIQLIICLSMDCISTCDDCQLDQLAGYGVTVTECWPYGLGR